MSSDEDKSPLIEGDGPETQGLPERRKRRESRVSMKDLMSLSGLGLEIVASICGMGLVGWAFDKWTGLWPWLTTVGLVLGLVGGLYNAVKQALNIQKGGWSYTKGPLGSDRKKKNNENKTIDRESGESSD